LSATPVIALPSAALAPASPRERESPPSHPSRPAGSDLSQFEHLVSEVEATQRLLSAARNPELQAPVSRQSMLRSDEATSRRRADLVVSNVPRLRASVSTRPSETELRVLSALAVTDNTSLPVAIRNLEGHLTELNRQAYALRHHPDFMTVVKKSNNQQLLKLLPPAMDSVRPGAWEIDKPRSTPDVDVRGRIKPLGIGDLKVVKQTLLGYVPGEVAHIENVLKGEFKERKHRTLDRTETLLLVSEEETQETERDTQTTDRFELKREAEKTIKEDMSVQAGLTVTGGFGPVSITAQGNFAYSTSQQESVKNSANFAREVVDRSVSKIQKK
jgi:hypothetical protein